MVCVGTDLETSRAAVALAERHEDVHATVGLHPHDAARLEAEWPALVELAKDPSVVAIGETGFDLHYLHSPFEEQEAAFRAQIQLAHATDRALVIHSREAWDDTFRVLEDEGVPPARCSTASPADPTKRGAHSTSAPISRSAGSSRSRPRTTCAPRPSSPRSSGCSSKPTRRTSRRCRIAEARTSPLVAVVGAGVAAARGEPVEEIAAASRATAAAVFLQ